VAPGSRIVCRGGAVGGLTWPPHFLALRVAIWGKSGAGGAGCGVAWLGKSWGLPDDSTTCRHLSLGKTLANHGLASRRRVRRVFWKVFAGNSVRRGCRPMLGRFARSGSGFPGVQIAAQIPEIGTRRKAVFAWAWPHRTSRSNSLRSQHPQRFSRLPQNVTIISPIHSQ
jgi:hypothetical protein